MKKPKKKSTSVEMEHITAEEGNVKIKKVEKSIIDNLGTMPLLRQIDKPNIPAYKQWGKKPLKSI